ncbi:MAG TPA: HlyD family efflux transporter periplasmic adaptor subunit [Rhizomicrobium sp.]|nr:HlyD family efflux transporter periplasmic adaptor subunit [Rhizomicrobium sp.]
MAAFLDVRSRAQADAAVKSAEAARALAASELEKAKAQLAFTASDLSRAKRLSQSNAIATVDLERAQLAYNTALAARNTAEAALEAKQYDLLASRTLLVDPADYERLQHQRPSMKLLAPVSGKVLRVLHENESVVPAGSPILEIGDPKNLEILVELVSQSAVKIHEGNQARITDWGGPGELPARVRRIEPGGFTKVSALGVEEQRVNVLLDFTGSARTWEAIGDGFRVNAHIVYWEDKDVLRVSAAGLFRHGDGWAVFAVRDGKAALTPVKIGESNDEFAEALSGVKAGDLVVVHPSDRIGNGTSVSY